MNRSQLLALSLVLVLVDPGSVAAQRFRLPPLPRFPIGPLVSQMQRQQNRPISSRTFQVAQPPSQASRPDASRPTSDQEARAEQTGPVPDGFPVLPTIVALVCAAYVGFYHLTQWREELVKDQSKRPRSEHQVSTPPKAATSSAPGQAGDKSKVLRAAATPLATRFNPPPFWPGLDLQLERPRRIGPAKPMKPLDPLVILLIGASLSGVAGAIVGLFLGGVDNPTVALVTAIAGAGLFVVFHQFVEMKFPELAHALGWTRRVAPAATNGPRVEEDAESVKPAVADARAPSPPAPAPEISAEAASRVKIPQKLQAPEPAARKASSRINDVAQFMAGCWIASFIGGAAGLLIGGWDKPGVLTVTALVGVALYIAYRGIVRVVAEPVLSEETTPRETR